MRAPAARSSALPYRSKHVSDRMDQNREPESWPPRDRSRAGAGESLGTSRRLLFVIRVAYATPSHGYSSVHDQYTSGKQLDGVAQQVRDEV